jgi:hypothetical protein
MITAMNVFILCVLLKSFLIHLKRRGDDKNFHSLMLTMCVLLLLANTFACVTAIYSYFVFKIESPEVLNFGRFADRYAMFFAYIVFGKITKRYYGSEPG